MNDLNIPKRPYKDGSVRNAHYFVGTEIEYNAFIGLKTLFVQRVKNPDFMTIIKYATKHNVRAIYLDYNYELYSDSSFLGKLYELIEQLRKDTDFQILLNVPFTPGNAAFCDVLHPSIHIVYTLTGAKRFTGVSIKFEGERGVDEGVQTYNLDRFGGVSQTLWHEYEDDEVVEE